MSLIPPTPTDGHHAAAHRGGRLGDYVQVTVNEYDELERLRVENHILRLDVDKWRALANLHCEPPF